MRQLTLYIGLLLCLVSLAQDRSYIAGSYTPGFLLAHRADIKNLAAHNYGLELAYEKQMNESDWGKFYKNPVVGYGLLYYNLGKEETGHALGGMAHVKLQLFQIKSAKINFRMGAGIAYLSTKFDVYSNRRNQAIGSHLNGSMQFGLIANTPIRNGTDYLEYGFSISHYSNAAFKVPNLGYNIPSFTIRYGFGFNEAKTIEELRKSEAFVKYDWQATLIYGKKQRNFANPVDFYNFGIQLRGIKNLSESKAWRFGLDYTLDKTYKFSEDNLYPLDSITLGEQSEIAIAAGFQWSFGRTDVLAEIGAYLYKPAVLKNPLNQRVGLAYHFSDRITGQGTLRFHRGVADFFEIGVGYTL